MVLYTKKLKASEVLKWNSAVTKETYGKSGRISKCWCFSLAKKHFWYFFTSENNTFWNMHVISSIFFCISFICIWAASSEFGTYRLCEQRRLRRACASAQSRQNLRCSLIQAMNQEETSDRKPDPWPLWMAGHAQLKFVMTECSKTLICLTRHI